ncbi:hypothetical protein TRFO_03711 [Tritrichomonas foetus]|uniref:Transmembrane protein n=1 Tax=Tritrichomonas foetus TaxID=1144522 RepID=A0A1J4KLT1_9EUKA|nr:hypothetical protein TRFO_03711 [Tritrichomonas foetus]|eukprot:OHT12090.1 hypothetical protein TRFO_03711 [Tritrichomonas foetus]
MNLTLISLTLNSFSLASPFLSYIVDSQKSNFHVFSNIFISNSFRPFLFADNLNANTHIKNSQFQRFLDSPISIIQQNINDGQNTKNSRLIIGKKFRNPIFTSYDYILNVSDCLFKGCSGGISGGAINFLHEDGELNVYRCGFLHCSANSKGGAISFFGDAASIKFSCMNDCSAFDSAMAIEIFVNGDTMKMTLNYLTITKCAEDHSTIGDITNVIDLMNGHQNIETINSSLNSVALSGGFVWSDECDKFNLKFVTVFRNTCDCMFNLYDLNEKNSLLSFSNIINNSANIALTLFDIDNSSIIVSSFSFYDNNFTFLASNGNLMFSACVCDFDLKTVPLENANFSIDSSTGWGFFDDLLNNKLHLVKKTQDIQKMETVQCWVVGKLPPTPSQSIPAAANIFRNENKHHHKNEKSDTSGLFVFVIVAGCGSFVAFFYYTFYKTAERDLNNLQDVEMM